MNWNIFWAVYCLVFAAACLIVAYALGWRSMHKENRCTERTRGKVIRYSAAEYNGVHLPVVKYYVDGREYKKTGPHFKAGVTKSVSTPFHQVESSVDSNIPLEGELPDVIKVSRSSNSFVSVYKSPLAERYPVGKEVEVFYNPNNPKDAYVERYAGTVVALSFWMPLIFGIILVTVSLAILFGPTIVMK